MTRAFATGVVATGLAVAVSVAAAAGSGHVTPASEAGTPAVQAPAPAPQPPPPPAVKVGEPMPDFSLNYLEPTPPGERPQSKTVKLSDYKGKQVVVLAFFPAAFSPG